MKKTRSNWDRLFDNLKRISVCWSLLSVTSADLVGRPRCHAHFITAVGYWCPPCVTPRPHNSPPLVTAAVQIKTLCLTYWQPTVHRPAPTPQGQRESLPRYSPCNTGAKHRSVPVTFSAVK